MSEEALEEIKYYSEMYPDGIHKKSEAKELFKKLGYEYNEDEFYIRYYENNDMTVKNNIIFCKDQRCIELIPKFNNKDHYFTRVNIPLLQAINQQVKELGWK